MYDQQEIVGARYYAFNGNVTEYEYVKDAYGNVVAVVNGNSVVVQYRYDAWGNCTEVNKNANDPFANINPIRYRSYYLDLETGYYYLHNRYYDPEIGAFISPDSTEYLDPESIGGLNLYAYCLNNPVMYYDPNGNLALTTLVLIFIGVGVAVGVGTVLYLDYQDDGQIFNGSIGWETYLAAALLGGIIGGVLGYYAGPTIASLLANPGNISLASLVFAGGGSTGGLTISVAAVGQIALAGAISTTDIGTIGATYMFSKAVTDPDPFKRPNQKKQGRENKNKSRKQGNWSSRSNKRNGPNPPKKHTPGRDHNHYKGLLLFLLGLMEIDD